MENNTLDRASESEKKDIIKEYMRALQKKSAEARKRNNPDTYKLMVKRRWEKREELEVKVE